MPVPSALSGISQTDASNSPQGSDSIGTNLDDYLRGIQAVFMRGLSYKGADIASVAGTMDIGAVEGLMHDITGALAITSLGTVRAGIWKILKFEGAATLTHNATSLILPGAANIVCADGDVGIFISEGSGNWRCLNFWKAAHRPGNGIVSGTEQASTSGTSIDFTSIPAGVKRITVMLVGVSTNGTDSYLVQIGDSGGVENTGYNGADSSLAGSVTTTAYSAGFLIQSASASNVCHGVCVLDLEDGSDNTWVEHHEISMSNAAQRAAGSGSKALSATLDRVRVTTTGGTNTFDAGAINVSYEF